MDLAAKNIAYYYFAASIVFDIYRNSSNRIFYAWRSSNIAKVSWYRPYSSGCYSGFNGLKMQYDVLFVLSYYSPYVSGLTNYVKHLAEALAARGYRIQVVTNQHDSTLPQQEVINGVNVIRAGNAFNLGKAIISPHFVKTVVLQAKNAKIINLHYPLPEIYLLAKFLSKKLIVTYHCDVALSGIFGNLLNNLMDFLFTVSSARIDRIIFSSYDYAHHSRLFHICSEKIYVVPPPCLVRQNGNPSFRYGNGLHIGFLGRIVEEKGLRYLLDGFWSLEDNEARLLIGGDYLDIAGGSIIDQLKMKIDRDQRIKILGFIPDHQLNDFYASLDLFIVPSINAFEAFAITQAEALMLGIPVIASDLPGVRVPVLETKHGQIITPKSPDSITHAIIDVRNRLSRNDLVKKHAIELYSVESVVERYKIAIGLS